MYSCFTIMGFGKKMDYSLSKSVNLDYIYQKVIQPVVDKYTDIHNIRSDEIMNNNIIDNDMYNLLLNSDIVIADITTLNPNAMYELGVRHAFKPYSTLIMGLDDGSDIPFDIDHSRIFRYGINDIHDNNKLNNIHEKMCKIIDSIIKNVQSKKPRTDSPIYNNISGLNPPECDNLENNLKNINQKEDSIRNSSIRANDLIKKHKYLDASKVFKDLYSRTKYDYYAQQEALFLSKVVDKNSRRTKLEDAENVIKKLNPKKSSDTETVGIYGSIEKKMYQQTKKIFYLDSAIKSYNRGFVIQNDYYNGENLVNCLIFKFLNVERISDLIHLNKAIAEINKKVFDIAIAKKFMDDGSDYWLCATLANSAMIIPERKNDFKKYKDEFLEKLSDDWEKEAFEETENNRNKYLDKVKDLNSINFVDEKGDKIDKL